MKNNNIVNDLKRGLLDLNYFAKKYFSDEDLGIDDIEVLRYLDHIIFITGMDLVFDDFETQKDSALEIFEEYADYVGEIEYYLARDMFFCTLFYTAKKYKCYSTDGSLNADKCIDALNKELKHHNKDKKFYIYVERVLYMIMHSKRTLDINEIINDLCVNPIFAKMFNDFCSFKLDRVSKFVSMYKL